MNGLDALRRLVLSRRLALAGRVAAARGLAFVTGGTLRDLLLGLDVHDLDLVVDGDAAATAADLAEAFAGRVVRLGRPPLATWRVVAPRLSFDVAAIQGGVEADVRRRDFTVNAMLWKLPRGPFVDLAGGLDDLAAGRLRVVDPGNLEADPLRVLRGLRLIATRPLALTAASAAQLAAAAPGLARVARERIVDELRLLLSGSRPGRALAIAARLGILGGRLPGWGDADAGSAAARLAGALADLGGEGRGWLAEGARDVMAAVLAAPAAGYPGEWDVGRGQAALEAVGWPRRPGHEAVAAAALGERLVGAILGPEPAARELLAVGPGSPRGALAWASARAATAGHDAVEGAARLWRWWRVFRSRAPLVRGDLLARFPGLPPGPARAAALRALRGAQAAGAVRSRAQALRWLDEFLVR